jgi:hypothetical protein
MTDKVVHLFGNGADVPDQTHLDPDDILENNKGEYENVLILGWGKDGLLRICATDGVAETILLIEQAKMVLLTELMVDE